MKHETEVRIGNQILLFQPQLSSQYLKIQTYTTSGITQFLIKCSKGRISIYNYVGRWYFRDGSNYFLRVSEIRVHTNLYYMCPITYSCNK